MDNSQTNKKKKKIKPGVKVFIVITSVAFLVLISLSTIRTINSTPDTPSSTVSNCEIIHDIYTQEEADELSSFNKNWRDWEKYRDGTLYNFGLFTSTYIKGEGQKLQWNGTWVVDEDFIRTYVNTYSTEEFINIYKLYIVQFVDNTHKLVDGENFFSDKQPLLKHITETSTLIFNMPDVFNIINFDPTNDKVIKKTTETETVSGKFNVGVDNKIEHRSDTLTTDTYEYDGYTVKHRYGKEYCKGVYGWYNGEFKDVKPYFKSVNEYSLLVNNLTVLGPSSQLENLTRRWIQIGTSEYFEHKYAGIRTSSSKKVDFEEPVIILSIYETQKKQYLRD